jgi:pyruvate dehydrogenase E1 component alpha subunit
MKNELNNLSNPKTYNNIISIEDQDAKELKKMLELMIIIRKTEQKIAWGKKNKFIIGPVHLGVGQEAIAVGVSKFLKKTDRVFGAHRSHSHLLALNPNSYKLFAEVLGRKTGFSKGMGGSMHLCDIENGFYGSTPIVAGTVSLAVGAGMAAKLQNKDDIAVSYIGDGAVEEGVVHEAFNLSRVQNIPILFVIENNLFASHMYISLRQPSNKMSRFAAANDISYKVVEGNNVVEVANTAKELINNIRKDKTPRILELITYRWYGHVDYRDDIDVGVKRSIEDIKKWKAKDPISRLYNSMLAKKILDQAKWLEINDRIDNQINLAWEKAIKDERPSTDAILKYVYSSDSDN